VWESSRRIDDALTVLEKRRLARGERAYDTSGRPVDMWTGNLRVNSLDEMCEQLDEWSGFCSLRN
jgi:hypothetical protein